MAKPMSSASRNGGPGWSASRPWSGEVAVSVALRSSARACIAVAHQRTVGTGLSRAASEMGPLGEIDEACGLGAWRPEPPAIEAFGPIGSTTYPLLGADSG